MSGYSLLNDIIFKIVFGSASSVPVLRALLNALLGLQGSARIAELEILNPALDKEHLLDKGVVLDVKARDGQGRLYKLHRVGQVPAGQAPRVADAFREVAARPEVRRAV